MPIDLNIFKSPNIDWNTDWDEWYPRVTDFTHEELLDMIPFDEVERYVRNRKLKNIKKED